MVGHDKLSAGLRALGFPLMETEDHPDANLTLAEAVMSKDLRLWEAFPLLLANSAEKKLFDPVKVKAHLKTLFEKRTFDELLSMSLALYGVLNMKFGWSQAVSDAIKKEHRNKTSRFRKALSGNQAFNIGGREMSPERVRSAFNSYFSSRDRKLKDLLSEKEELGLEYALSQVFSPKQKELFLKKLNAEVLTKTEREYYSRAVKKKVLALANTRLHQLARKLMVG